MLPRADATGVHACMAMGAPARDMHAPILKLMPPQDSIKSSASWFMAQAAAGHAPALAQGMARRSVSLPEYDRVLHLIYLANDVLFKG